MMLKILMFLMSLPIASYDSNEGEWSRIDRLGTIARAISDESNGDRMLAAELIVDVKRESALRLDVQVCHCPPKQCDKGRAHSLVQAHRKPSQTVAQWWSYCGTDYDSVMRNLRHVSGTFRQYTNAACAFARLGGQSHCDSKWAMSRAAEARWIAGRL